MIERYALSEMRSLWSDQARYETWLEVELAACAAMEEQGLVPRGTTKNVRQSVTIDANRILEIENTTRHDVIAFLSHLEEQAGETARWLHLGMTSSDVLDTAFALQLHRAGELILEKLSELAQVLSDRAHELKDVAMVGRTHGIHAEPTSVGLVFAGYYAEVMRHRRRLEQAIETIATGKLAGAVGVYGNISPEVESRALQVLGLSPETCSTQIVPRDRHAELFCSLAQLAASIERMALQVRHWQRTEVGEAREPFRGGQKGSSAMPHKRNPILSENLCGLSRLVRNYASVALENVPLWHERDISHSSAERVIGPDSTTLVHFMLARITKMLRGLVVDPERIAQNLNHTKGLVFSESVMLLLVRKGLKRQHAYELVQRQAMAAQDSKKSFAELLASEAEIGKVLDADELDSCFDLSHHLQYVDYIFERVFDLREE